MREQFRRTAIKLLRSRYSHMSTVAIREANEEDAPFIGWAILTATRSHVSRGWFDITLGLDEAGCVAFTTRLARAETRSWWHYSNFSSPRATAHGPLRFVHFERATAIHLRRRP